MGDRIRLDEAIVLRGLAPTRARARDAVLRNCVLVDGRPANRPGMAVGAGVFIEMNDPALAWVSRAALKLVAGLDAFGFDPSGRSALDLGASTGGFTQVLLARGARRVFAVDVGHGQLSDLLAADVRVVSLENLNARDLTPAHLDATVEAIVADLSFVSLKLALEPALALAAPGTWLVALVKPQFELGPKALGKGGIVRDRAAGQGAAAGIATWLGERGWRVAGIVDSPIEGGSGNHEYLLGATRD